MPKQVNRLALSILAHAILRIASSASGVLIGIYLASLSGHGFQIDAGLLGTLGAVSFAAELVASIPFGMASDAISPRWLMVAGAVTGALAVQLFTLSPHVDVFFLSRGLEGIGVAAVTPPLLGFLAESTTHDSRLRARVMSFFELSLLVGLALGGLVGSQFWSRFNVHAFSLVALAYLACAMLLLIGAKNSRSHGSRAAFKGLLRALKEPSVRSLAPVWLCVNAVVGPGSVLHFHSCSHIDRAVRNFWMGSLRITRPRWVGSYSDTRLSSEREFSDGVSCFHGCGFTQHSASR
jgi:MFS family permease